MKSFFKKSAYILLLLTPPFVFFGMFFIYTVDIPINDDYKAVLNFINQLINTESLQDKLTLVCSQHNEHRIIYDRLWTIICYKLNNQVNFNYLALIGNVSLIGIFIVFYKKIKEINTDILLLLPISVLLFNITFWENMTFAMATLSNFTIFLFSLTSIYFLTKTKFSTKEYIFALLFFVLAVFTQGGGLMLIPLTVGILLYRKKTKYLYIYLIISTLIIIFYFSGYQKPDEAVSLTVTLADFKARSILFSFAFLGNAFNYYLIFTNDIEESTVITSIIGFIFFITYLYIIKTKYYQKNLFAFSVMTLIVITSFATGFSRSHMGLSTAGSSRYRIAGVIFVIGLYFWALETFKHSKKFKNSFLIGSLIYFLFFNLNQYEYLSYRKYKSMEGALKYQSGDHTLLNGFEQEMYKNVLVSSAINATYFLPSHNSLEIYFPFSMIENNKNINLVSSEIIQSVDNITKIKDSFIIEGYAFDNISSKDNKISVGLKSPDGNIVYFSTKVMPRFDLNPYFHKFNLRDSGFFARIKLDYIQKGNYKIILKLLKNNETRVIETDKTINY